METKAAARYIRISPRKIRLVMDQVRGMQVEKALNKLSFAPQKGARILKKLIDSAVANAEQNANVDVDLLYIKKIYADRRQLQRDARAVSVEQVVQAHAEVEEMAAAGTGTCYQNQKEDQPPDCNPGWNVIFVEVYIGTKSSSD